MKDSPPAQPIISLPVFSDEMHPKVTKRCVTAIRPGESSSSSPRGHSGAGGGGGFDPAADRLSALPDALLHHVLSFVKAWEAVRTCVLSRRWRDLWASAPCVDVRVGRYSRRPPQDFAKFVYRLLLAREALAPIDTLRLRSDGQEDEGFDEIDVQMWIRHAIRQNARVIQLTGHPDMLAELHSMDIVSRHLKILKLTSTQLCDGFSTQLSSRCPSLEELELKDCLVYCDEIASVSLKRLTMVKCTFLKSLSVYKNLTVDALNLVFVKCTAPETFVPVFKNFGMLVTGIVMLDDSLLSNEFKKENQEDDGEYPPTSDDDDDNNSNARKYVPDSDDSDQMLIDDPGFLDDYYNEHCLPDLNMVNYDYEHCLPDLNKDNHDYGSDINSDSDTYEYSEIAIGYEDKQSRNCDNGLDHARGSKDHGCSSKHIINIINDYKKLGGQNVLNCLSNARYLELLGHSGEVILRRESLRCPTFSNLKTLALAEWCISTGADFGILILLLQHSPSLEKLYLQLEMKALGRGVEPKGGSFACKHLSMVKIRCTKDDPRVHMLAQLFRSNGLPFEKIYVRRSGSFYLRNLKLERSITLD